MFWIIARQKWTDFISSLTVHDKKMNHRGTEAQKRYDKNVVVKKKPIRPYFSHVYNLSPCLCGKSFFKFCRVLSSSLPVLVRIRNVQPALSNTEGLKLTYTNFVAAPHYIATSFDFIPLRGTHPTKHASGYEPTIFKPLGSIFCRW